MMPPQPLSRVNSTCEILIDPMSVTFSEKICAGVLQVISTWSLIDHELALLLANIVKADFEIVTSMLNALSGDRARRDVIAAAVNRGVSKEKADAYTEAIRLTRASRARRNEFAHHIWAYSPELADRLLLINPSAILLKHSGDRARANEDWMKWTQNPLIPFPRAPPKPPPQTVNSIAKDIDRSHVFVYRLQDILEDVGLANVAHVRIQQMRAFIETEVSPLPLGTQEDAGQ